jgi:DinB superfamily
VNANDVLNDAFGRLPGLVRGAVRNLTPEQLTWAPATGANTIAWLVWHLARIQDGQVSELLGEEQVYLAGGWAPKFGLEADPSDTGYGHSATEVAAVRPASWHALVDYYTAVHERTVTYVEGLTEDDFDQIVDERWDPPVTVGVRLVSVLGDDTQHAGQAAYVRGLQ